MSAADGPGRFDARLRRSPHGSGSNIGPGRILVGFVIVAWGLLVRAVGRLFGISGEGSTLLTLIVLASVARGVRRALAAPRARIRKARSSPSFAGDTMIATAVFKESVDSIAGRASKETRFAAALIVFAVLAHFFRPAVSGSLGALRKSLAAVRTEALRLRDWMAAAGR
jgi:hypothetical protein